MLGRPRAADGIQRSYELRIDAELLQHPCVLAAHRAVRDRSSGSFGDDPRGPDRDCAVDDGQRRLKKPDVTCSLTDKILNGEWIADMEDIDRIGSRHSRRYVYSDNLMMLRDEFEERLADLSQARDDYRLFFCHCHDLLQHFLICCLHCPLPPFRASSDLVSPSPVVP